MKGKLSVYYDEEGDYVEFRIGRSTKGYFRDIGNDFLERRDAKTDEIKGFAILNLKKRQQKDIPTPFLMLLEKSKKMVI